MTMTNVLMTMDEKNPADVAPVGPRAGGPLRRTFSPAVKLAHVLAYEEALEAGEAGAYLRREGLHSASMSEWRRLHRAGVLEGKGPGQAVGRPSREQAEIGRLKQQLAQAEAKLATTEIALTIMGKAHALLEEISKSATDSNGPTRR